ncbi:MAG: TadE/TadG family type IV pilus assembly protein [Armatimonadota bacterium]
MNRIRRCNKGAALVEFAIVAMLLILLVFGIIEFSLIMRDYQTLSQAAREGARSAALGHDAETVTSVVRSSAVALPAAEQEKISVAVQYRTYSGSSWGGWQAGIPPAETAGSEVQVRVDASYPHPTIVGSLFGLGETRTLTGKMVMRRE